MCVHRGRERMQFVPSLLSQVTSITNPRNPPWLDISKLLSLHEATRKVQKNQLCTNSVGEIE